MESILKKHLIIILLSLPLIFVSITSHSKELNILLNSPSINLNSTAIPDQSSLFVSRHLSCQLFRHKNGYEIVPEAVKEFKILNNGTLVNIKLIDDLYFVGLRGFEWVICGRFGSVEAKKLQ